MEVVPELKAVLGDGSTAVLVAPPGAGKTTAVPLALLDEPWAERGKLILLEPRRLAARAAAARMAATLNEPVGQTVGYRIRLDSRVSAATRIEVVTDGVFSRMIMEDPGLERVSAVFFDEFHERSLDTDLGLAFARDSQVTLRPDLRLLVMSATLDPVRVSQLLGDAPVLECAGRRFDVETRYLGRGSGFDEHVARAVRTALAEQAGGVLVFLPGQGEIRRLSDRLTENLRDRDVIVAPLYGALEGAEQDRAIAMPPPGYRKVVLATDIAQTSLTIEGVQTVIDAGLARVPRYDAGTGLTRLTTVRASRASVDQRRGRAGRTQPGVCYRLWDEAETRGLTPFDSPEILETDLARVALDMVRWGAKDIGDLALLDRPSPAAMTEAQTFLRVLGATDERGLLTDHGRAMSRLPLPPRLANMVLTAARRGQGARAAQIAALISERGLGGSDVDLSERLAIFLRDRTRRGLDAAAMARRWAALAGGGPAQQEWPDGLILAHAFPERIAKARGAPGRFQLVGGREVFLEPSAILAREKWLAVAELGGGASRDRILLAAALDIEDLKSAFRARLIVQEHLEPSAGGVMRARERVLLGKLVVEERLIANPDPSVIEAALVNEVREKGLGVLRWGPAALSLRARAAFLGIEDLDEERLAGSAEAWLKPLIAGGRPLASVDDPALYDALRGLLSAGSRQRLELEAPTRWTAPSGSSFPIDYAAEGGPRVDVRVQEVFGLTVHPTVGRGAPLVLALLSPARRPIQLTKDVPGFWTSSWRDVRREMRGRYPKHFWPEYPAVAIPTTRAKPRT
jgi:ATP-dependent helicase HrpB